jgi:N-acetylneuraminic acid mutarotase
MKQTGNILLLALGILLSSCQQEICQLDKAVERCVSAPVALTSAASFSLNGKGYVFGGRDLNGEPTNHIYCYDPVTDSWSDLGSTPLKARVRPRAIAVNGEVFIGMGFNGHVLADSAYLSDWWKWTPSSDTWTRLISYPSERTVGAVTVTDGNYIYAACGGKQNFERWIFRYDISNDRWTQLADELPRMADYPPRTHSASGGMCADCLYLGAGYTRDGSSDFWTKAELKNDSIIWHKCAPLKGKRHNATAVSDGQYIYLCGGSFYGGTLTTGIYYDDILRYEAAKDEWVRLGHLPDDARENMISWVIDGTLYTGLGNDKRNTPCAQLYRVRL